MKIVRNLTAMAAVATALTIAAQARANTIDFYLNQPECTGGCGAGTAPALISNSSAVEVIVDEISSTSATVELIAPGSSSTNIDTPAYINVNDGGTVGNVTATVSIAGGVTRSDPGQAEDHFGNMNTWTSSVEAHTVTFTLTAVNGFTWTDAADVLMATTGYGAAYSHGFEAVTAGQDAGYYTPLPAALPLFASGLGAMGLLGWRRKRKNAAAIAAA